MATTFTGHEFYSRKILKALPAQLNFLGAFSTDVSGELLGPSKSVEVPLVEMDAAGSFNRDSNNFARTAMTPKTMQIPSAAISQPSARAARYNRKPMPERIAPPLIVRVVKGPFFVSFMSFLLSIHLP